MGALAVSSVTGCLRLTEPQGQNNTARAEETTREPTPKPTVVGLEERWDHEDAGLGVNFSPDLVQADGDRVFAFGPQTALLDPAVPTPINTVDISAGVDGGVNEVSDAIVDEDACYLGAIGETPLIVQTDRMASEVQGSVQLSSEL